jgi:hypothetical protein
MWESFWNWWSMRMEDWSVELLQGWGLSRSEQRSFILAGYFEPDPYTRFQIADRALNTAIVQTEITRGFEEYLEIFDEFYADDIEVTSDTRKERKEPIRGKKRLRSLLLNFLVPFT